MRPCSYSSVWDIKEESLSSDSTLISWVCERARSPKQKRWFQREIAWLETTDQRRTFTRNEMRARSVTNTHTCSQTSRHKHWIVRGLGTAGLHSCTLTQAPQTCGYHKGPCHMLSRYIPTQWCQFVHLNLRLLIYSSETLQLKDKVNSVQSFFFFVVDKLRFHSNGQNSFVLWILWWNVWKCSNGKHCWVVPKYSCMIYLTLFIH